MFQTVFFSTLLTFTFIESVKNRWTCNTSDGEITYSSCDDKKPIPTINVEPCVSWTQTKGNLSFYYVPRRDMRDLYFNIHAVFKSAVILPLKKEVICHGADGNYSFCRVLKGETINTTLFFSFSFLKFPKGFYILIAEAFSGGIEDSLFCCNITLKLK
ncbi:lymphocyte antigen 96 isoform X1 [Phascolarctos cinereus]|uniref:Lymphocyte antigen 96 isoform X1 n=1 Tax=Phascolarctos cinereus TaxID=38626 RepID=A0A6P5IX80_PHACI|nr:lymphocyte antigen 96 isoform X1 [Phascolarctos cinereus]